MHMLEMALKTDLPILGICRGAQLLNVVLGGSLLQDIRPLRRQTPNRWTILPVKDALTEPGSLLRRCLQCDTVRVNSMHTQAIGELAPALRVSARDRDQFVQAVEMPTRRFVIGVQWHPEYLPYLQSQRRLLRAFQQAVCATPHALH
jgi:putative glutamine amidotransferase